MVVRKHLQIIRLPGGLGKPVTQAVSSKPSGSWTRQTSKRVRQTCQANYSKKCHIKRIFNWKYIQIFRLRQANIVSGKLSQANESSKLFCLSQANKSSKLQQNVSYKTHVLTVNAFKIFACGGL